MTRSWRGSCHQQPVRGSESTCDNKCINLCAWQHSTNQKATGRLGGELCMPLPRECCFTVICGYSKPICALCVLMSTLHICSCWMTLPCRCPAAHTRQPHPDASSSSRTPGSSSGSGSSVSSSSSHPDTTAAGDDDGDNGDDGLQVTAVWQGKTPTRVPEALWFSFKPEPSAVDSSSWRLHKLSSAVHPHEVGVGWVMQRYACACCATDRMYTWGGTKGAGGWSRQA